jgi:hypothetical protein
MPGKATAVLRHAPLGVWLLASIPLLFFTGGFLPL